MARHILSGLVALTIACGGAAVGEETTTAHATDQVSVGKQLYAHNCASCHGDGGQGTSKAPPVVGKDALPLNPRPTAKLRTMEFRTAEDVFEFVKTNMPKDKPGSLSDNQYAAILAFDLQANGIDTSQTHVDRSTAASIVLHP